MTKAKTAPGQLDLIDMIDAIEYETIPVVCLYRSTARGLDARRIEIDATPRRLHAWSLSMCVPANRTVRCNATVLCASTRTRVNGETWPCGCHETNALMYRGACLGVDCTWEGEPHDRENPAVEDAMDHAWPGWRDVPIVDHPPFADKKADERWLKKVVPLYPAGWIEGGGPVRTARDQAVVGRHHGPATPFGGYDMGAIKPAPNQEDK